MRYLLVLLFLMCVPAVAQEPAFVYFNVTPCGNDWRTSCQVIPEGDGAVFKIYSGFMSTPRVKEGTLTAQEWEEFQRNVIEPAVEYSLPAPPGFLIGYHLTTPRTPEGRELPVAAERAFLDSKPGEFFRPKAKEED